MVTQLKKSKMKVILYTILVSVFFTTQNLYAQGGLSDLIKSGPGDATKLLNGYAEPLFKGIGESTNGGWTNTAKTKKLLKFDLRISASGTFVPTSGKSFDVSKIGLSNNVRPADPNNTIAPTFAGDKNIGGPTLNIYDDNGNKVQTFNMPSGQFAVIPSPQIQLTLGLINNTDITIRGIPSVTVGGDKSTYSLIGFGIKHDIMQDIAGKTADALVPFDLAVAFGYSHTSLNIPLTVQPETNAEPENSSQSTDFTNQHLSGSFNSLMFQAIISKKFLAFTPFVALGYNTTHTSASAVGNYPITTGGNLLTSTYTTFPNPINIKETSISGARADVGFQLELGFFRLYGSYSIAQYQSVNAGIGFGL